MTKTNKSKKQQLKTTETVKEARFIRFPLVLEEWLVKKHSNSGFKNVNQLVVDLVRREYQQDQAL